MKRIYEISTFLMISILILGLVSCCCASEINWGALNTETCHQDPFHHQQSPQNSTDDNHCDCPVLIGVNPSFGIDFKSQMAFSQQLHFENLSHLGSSIQIVLTVNYNQGPPKGSLTLPLYLKNSVLRL